MNTNVLFTLSLVLFSLHPFSSDTLADQFATTEDGRKVLLKDDGTWQYVQEAAHKVIGKSDTEKAVLLKEKEDRLLIYVGSGNWKSDVLEADGDVVRLRWKAEEPVDSIIKFALVEEGQGKPIKTFMSLITKDLTENQFELGKGKYTLKFETKAKEWTFYVEGLYGPQFFVPYIVKKGDTLASLAEKHEVRSELLRRINHLDADKEIREWHKIWIPSQPEKENVRKD